jgi:hypothetical protein
MKALITMPIRQHWRNWPSSRRAALLTGNAKPDVAALGKLTLWIIAHLRCAIIHSVRRAVFQSFPMGRHQRPAIIGWRTLAGFVASSTRLQPEQIDADGIFERDLGSDVRTRTANREPIVVDRWLGPAGGNSSTISIA